jgi:poly(beta-D-mannuronate) C5 epimerase
VTSPIDPASPANSRTIPKLAQGRRRTSTRLSVRVSLVTFLVLNLWIIYAFSTPVEGLTPFKVVYRAPYVAAPDPEAAAIAGLPLETSKMKEGVAKPVITTRAILVHQHRVELIVGGRRIRIVENDYSGVISIPYLYAAIHDPSWIQETSPGTFLLRAALVDQSDAFVAIAPATRAINMPVGADVFMSFSGVSAWFVHVKVASVGIRTWISPRTPRPFLAFDHDAVAKIEFSVLKNLGFDWTQSYGLSFFGVQSGLITHTLVEGDFIGLYCQAALNLKITNDTMSRNHLYGIDPHTDSSDLTISHNNTSWNAAHGIIFSVHVTHSKVIDNVSSHNGESGIVMDRASNHNLISGNLISMNRGDGIELTRGSGHEQITGNVIDHVRVAFRVDANSGFSTAISGNRIRSVVTYAQGIKLSANSNNFILSENGWHLVSPGRWTWIFKFVLWPLIGVAYFIVLVIRRRELANGWASEQIFEGRDASRVPWSFRRLFAGYRLDVQRQNRNREQRNPIEILDPLPYLGPPPTDL